MCLASNDRDRRDAAVEKGPREGFVGGDVEIREEDEPLAQSCVLPGDRLLHLEQQIRVPPNIVDACDARTGCLVRRVRERTALPRAVLDRDVVTALNELTRTGGRERDAVFVGLDLFRNADLHGATLPCGPCR